MACSREDRRNLFRTLVLRRIDGSTGLDDEQLRLLIEEVIRDYSRNEKSLSIAERRTTKKDVFDSLRGLDVLQDLMDDSSITEIMVNGPEAVFYERDGRLYQSERHFHDRKRLEDIIQKIAAGVNRVVNEANPVVDSRLSDGSRVHAVLPPVSLSGPVLTIRKFPKNRITMEQLIAMGSITREAAEYLKVLVRAGYNIFVSGGTGVGKTTFLNVLSDYIPPGERIITIEDSAELQISNILNLVSLEMREANMEGNHAVTIRDLIKASLRMRPSRIIVGEVRDSASIDMLQALNTGHNGMSTGHSNSPADMISRLETMVLLGEEIPLLAIRKQIASAIEIIIQLGRLRDKSRRVTEIVEVGACVDGEVTLNPLFCFEEQGEAADGRVIGTLRYMNNPLRRKGKLLAAGEEECLPDI